MVVSERNRRKRLFETTDMKKTKNKILPFPSSKQAAGQSIICQIGRERFAIHIEVEDLPPAASLIHLKSPPRKGKQIK
jgi:hypothetical protein